MSRNINRRAFLKGGVATAAAAMTAGAIGCAPAGRQGGQSGASNQAETSGKTYSFETAPDQIPDSDIASTVEADVVVVGAGTAGLCCANSALEEGLNVIVIAASDGPSGIGGSNFAVNSKAMEALGLRNDIPTLYKKELVASSFQVNESKWAAFAQNSETAMNWLIDKMEAAGYRTVIEKSYEDPDGISSLAVGAHGWIGDDVNMAGAGQPLVVKTLAQCVVDAGGDIQYGVTAKQLVRDNDGKGRVSAVIADGKDGHVKYIGKKAVVLATGDFGGDPEMVEKYCPNAMKLTDGGMGICDGSGHKMGLWAGAAWQKNTPNAIMALSALFPSSKDYQVHTGLLVNANGKRFCSEDLLASQLTYQQAQQPDRFAAAIWTANYAEAMQPWQVHGAWWGDGEFISTPEEVIAGWEEQVAGSAAEETRSGMEGGRYANGFFKADTLDALAEKLGIDAENLKATVAKYNEMTRAGEDTEFFKRADLMVPIDEAGPFYGSSMAISVLIITGGLRTDASLRVLDENDNVIDGLYAVGTISGDMFYGSYNFMMPGHNLGANCVTFGYLAGKDIAAQD